MSDTLRKYLSPKNYLVAIFLFINRNILHYIDKVFAPSHKEQFPFSPIFIVGAPRSGSTLLFQVLTDALDFGYLSNAHCRFFGSPALAERLLRPLKNKKKSDYTSFHGQTKGWAAPSECGAWWYRFFRHDPAYVTLQDVDPKKMINFRRSLLALTKIAGKPVLFKNLYASLRMEAIGRYIPEALFIVIKRDVFFNAASILAGRKKTFGTYNKWWSVPPPNVDSLLNTNPAHQVVGQINSIYEEIERVVQGGYVDHERVLYIKYEDLCTNSYFVLAKIEQFVKENGIMLKRRFDIPGSFPVDRNVNLDEEIASLLCAELDSREKVFDHE